MTRVSDFILLGTWPKFLKNSEANLGAKERGKYTTVQLLRIHDFVPFKSTTSCCFISPQRHFNLQGSVKYADLFRVATQVQKSFQPRIEQDFPNFSLVERTISLYGFIEADDLLHQTCRLADLPKDILSLH